MMLLSYHYPNMILTFRASDHSYNSSDTPKEINWMGVTSFLGKFKKKFDTDSVAIKSSKNRKSKWYGLKPQEIKDHWKRESLRSTTDGSWYHDREEKTLLSLPNMFIHGSVLPIVQPIYNEAGDKVAPVQRLEPGVYPEHFVYLLSAELAGQSDVVIVDHKGYVHILDYKTNKKIDRSSWANFEGVTDRMGAPLEHLDDCNYNHYNLQLSLYMYMILRQNPRLKPGSITMRHVIFQLAGRDQFEFPILERDKEGHPIVAEEIDYDLPYLFSEVKTLVDLRSAELRSTPVEVASEDKSNIRLIAVPGKEKVIRFKADKPDYSIGGLRGTNDELQKHIERIQSDTLKSVMPEVKSEYKKAMETFEKTGMLPVHPFTS